MAKKVDQYFLDGFLEILDNCTHFAVCSAEPANHAGIAAVTLASKTITAGHAGADYSLGAGSPDGRALTTAQQADISITVSGDATHVVRSDGTNIVVTTCTTQTLTSGGTVTVNAYAHTIRAVT